MHFVAPSEHQVLVFLVQVTVMLAVARLLGQASRRIGLPTVVGELAAGIVIGPSVLGRASPRVFGWLFPEDTVSSGMLFTVGWLGVMMLLVVTGFETDLRLISRLGRAAALVTLGSLALPFALGLGSGFITPGALVGENAQRVTFALFLATALTISSLPVIAKILSELELLRRNFGQLTLAVGMANDVIGWVLLGLIAGLAGSGDFDGGKLLTTIGALIVFLLLAALIGQRIVDGVMGTMRRLGVGVGGFVTVAVAFALGIGAVTQAIGVEGVLGAFIAGILLGRSRYTRAETEEHLQIVTSSVLAPIFFATAGLRVDLGALGDTTVIIWTVIIVVVASVAKFIGSWAGARAAGLGNRDGMALGAALNARGALEIIIATVGLSLGVLNNASYTIVVIMAIVTSTMASPVLRLVTHNWPGSPDEVIRLRREERQAANVLLRPTRALLVADGQSAATVAAELANAALPEESPVTIMRTVDEPSAVLDVTRALTHRDLELSVNRDVDDLLRRAGMGYGLAVAGTRATSAEELSAEITALLRYDLPVLLARPAIRRSRHVGRVVLPLSNSVPSRAATEVALAIAEALDVELKMLHVHSTTDHDQSRPAHRRGPDPVAHQMFSAVQEIAREQGVWTRRTAHTNASRAAGIAQNIDSRTGDLVVIGVEVQDVAGTVHFGQTVTLLLAEADLNLLIVALGPR